MRIRLRRSPGVVGLSWGLIDQGFSSATNFGLTVIAGRTAGPAGLGFVYLGFSAYLVALTMQRALVSDPLILASAPCTAEERTVAARKALTMVIAAGALSTLLLLLFGLLLPGGLGEGLLLFVPWLIGALVQDFWRALLFRDRRGSSASLNDGVWAAVMLTSLPLLLMSHGQWVVVSTWGAGALAAGLLGFLQTGIRPAGLRDSIRWWKAEAWPLARWLGPESVVVVVQLQVAVFVLVAILGAADVGGLRAVQAVFAPMSLLAQALSLPGLPMLATIARSNPRAARAWALRLSAVGVGLVLAYLGVLAILPRHLLGAIFGSSFDGFDGLIAPTGVAQVLAAAGLGMSLLLKAGSRVRALLLSRVIASVATLILVVLLAVADGVVGAAWGIAMGFAVGFLSVGLLAFGFTGRPITTFDGPGQ